jgi:cyclopropane-fatty-acyl-phospholipid synthase
MTLRERVLSSVRRRLGPDGLPLRLAFWDGAAFDLGPSPAVTMTLTRPAILRALLRGDVDRLAESYVDGTLLVDGRLQDILALGISLAERVGRNPWLRRLGAILGKRRFRHTRQADAQAIRHHYDVSNEFYALWLDRHMTYSCAYFETGAEDIDRAQEQKLDHLCRKLRLKPGERLLDIGCGWGGLLRWAARRYDVSGVGVTLSERQYAYAQRRIAEEGLGDRLEVRLQDYRDIPGESAFDKIVSVGMYEHVGRANLPLYFATIRRLLRDGGIALNHGITTGDPEDASLGPPGGGFIDRYVFPGGELPHLSRVVREMARQGLEVLDVECLRPHYAETLLRWVRRLEAARDQAIALAGIERYRIWRIYMAGCAYAFDRGWLSIHQVIAVKPDASGLAPRPWTRRYQYDATAPVRESGPLRWGDL